MKRKIKICGVKEPQDISVCNDIGVDFIGFNFANISPRKINPKYAKEKKLYEYCDKIERVAVFVNPSDDHIMESTKSIKATYIQLHGDESIERCKEIKDIYKLPLIKAFGIENADDLNKAMDYNSIVDYFLFDAKPEESKDSQKGGLNKIFDWKILDNWEGKHFFLAGGININNIKYALENSKAYCIDISSGVEIELGVKDRNMIKELYKEFNALVSV